jgi:hypothetical protein
LQRTTNKNNMPYHSHSIHMSKQQARSLGAGHKIRISHEHLSGPHSVMLTKTQVAKIHKAKTNGSGVQLQLSRAALRHNYLKGSGAFTDFLKKTASKAIPMALNYGAKALGDKIVQKINGGSFEPAGY